MWLYSRTGIEFGGAGAISFPEPAFLMARQEALENNYDFGTSALFVKRRLFVAISSNIHRFIEDKANYDLNREINIFDIGNEKNTVVS